MRRISVLCAAAGLAVTAFVAASPAEASYHLIRWQDTGFCQIWDESIPTAPWPSDFARVSTTVPTFVDALVLKDHALKRRPLQLVRLRSADDERARARRVLARSFLSAHGGSAGEAAPYPSCVNKS